MHFCQFCYCSNIINRKKRECKPAEENFCAGSEKSREVGPPKLFWSVLVQTCKSILGAYGNQQQHRRSRINHGELV